MADGIAAHKNVPSPVKTDAGNHIMNIAGSVLMTGLMTQSGTGAPEAKESGGITVSTSGVQSLFVDLESISDEGVSLSSGADAFYSTYVWIRGDAEWRYSTHKKDIFGAGKSGYYPVDADKAEVVPVSDLNNFHICGEAGPVRIFYKVFNVKSKFNRRNPI